MDKATVQALYGSEYAERFNEIWHHSQIWAPDAKHHTMTLSSYVTPTTQWLDVGCGTGWMLSKFADVPRAGVDISPDMLTEARKANPDALFFREGDMRDDVPEWHGAWDLVSCIGAPWSYVDSMDDIHKVTENLAAWTAPSGKCLLAIYDIVDYVGIETPYPPRNEDRPIDCPVITGVFWSFYDAGGLHQNMVAPVMHYWIDLFSLYFRRVEIIHWPHDPPFLYTPRRILVASDKRVPGDTSEAEVIIHPVPQLTSEAEGPTDRSRLATDFQARLQTPEGRLEATLADSAGWATSTPVLSQTKGPLGSALQTRRGGRPLAGRPWYEQPLSYLVGRLRPWEARFWRSVGRRVQRRRR